MNERQFKFKAWDKEARLLVRLNNIGCTKGVLFKRGHILLQFTGLLDKSGVEVYENDILLAASKKIMILWDEQSHGWVKVIENNESEQKYSVDKKEIAECIKLCNYYESPESFIIK